jgi:hypothetical protein
VTLDFGSTAKVIRQRQTGQRFLRLLPVIPIGVRLELDDLQDTHSGWRNVKNLSSEHDFATLVGTTPISASAILQHGSVAATVLYHAPHSLPIVVWVGGCLQCDPSSVPK